MRFIRPIVFAGLVALFNTSMIHADSGLEDYSSFLVNASTAPYILVKTNTTFDPKCLIAGGQQTIAPGAKTELVIAKDKSCNKGQVEYALYKAEDKEHKNLQGHLAHRFQDGKFSFEVSMDWDCKGRDCIFKN